VYLITVSIICSCAPKKQREVVLYETYCASCHLAPDIQSLPKTIWEEYVLPDMAARMGIISAKNHPYHTLSFPEQFAVVKAGVYPSRPIIDVNHWELLKKYIIELAPDSLAVDKSTIQSSSLTQFSLHPMRLNSATGSTYTFLQVNPFTNLIFTGTRSGELAVFDPVSQKNKVLGNFNSAISNARVVEDSLFVTTMGKLDPSEIASGRTVMKSGNTTAVYRDSLHRPVHTLYIDLDKNGTEEMVICEYGDLQGALTLMEKDGYGFYSAKTLLDVPGALRVVPRDMNTDGKEDLVVLAAQGDESMYILYQEENLTFRVEKILRFSPVYGSSWFELIDYDGDGFEDIITVNGDNADESYVQKPYHGMRIHLNDGNNHFKETYFHPLNGATRLIAKDFDQDGDLDMALLATFPDYELHPEYNFVYLENLNSTAYTFKQQHLADTKMARWFLMDAADIDGDGDDDIVLSALNYSFTPVPEAFEKAWSESKTDLLILTNTLH
ncbi:MAG: VCBS repeat-containing protein, partial [Maribacter sp.]